MKNNRVDTYRNKSDSDSAPIFTISSNDIDDKRGDANSKDEDGTNTPRKWTQVTTGKF